MIIEAIVRKDRKLSLLQRIGFTPVIAQATKLLDFSELLDNLSEFSSRTPHTQYTDSSAISSLSADEKGKNIYFSAEINNPQKLYRTLSQKGFSLIDSKISR